jgi:hypothetical protein
MGGLGLGASVYDSIRQHTSAYVSIRQHTSGFGWKGVCRGYFRGALGIVFNI